MATTTSAPRVAFVPQQDVLPPLLTVHEALLFAARLRLPEHIPYSALIARVDALIAQLGLERVRDARIGGSGKRGLSGGEMRRVSIGLELVGAPDVVLLDEPTSGLDAVSAANVAKVLRGVANGAASGSAVGDEDGQSGGSGKTAVIATIHQPSSGLYRLFDSVVLLSQGRAMYVGEGGMEPVHSLQRRGVGGRGENGHEWTEGYNVADWLLEVASEEQWKAEMGDTVGGGGSLEKTAGEGVGDVTQSVPSSEQEKHTTADGNGGVVRLDGLSDAGSGATAKVNRNGGNHAWKRIRGPAYATTFLTQFAALAGREWKILRR